MKNLLRTLVVLIAVLTAVVAFADASLDITPRACLECHEDSVTAAEFKTSVHGQNSCTSCHVEINNLAKHADGDIEVGQVSCAGCHQDVAASHAGSVHAENEVGCIECHAQIHSLQSGALSKPEVALLCENCHDTEAYQASAHAKAVAAGNLDAPSCTDCHGLHEIKTLGEGSEAHLIHTEACVDCHSSEDVIERNDLRPHTVETFLESYHGKSVELGFPELVAGCADCHTPHMALPASDPASSIHPANLVETCSQCHPKATVQFTKYYAHADHADSENYPILYYTFMAMTGLLVGTFAVFWIHTLLWMFRGFIENREKQKLMAQGHEHHITEAHRQYQRFQKRHIFLHLTVIVSFLGLSLTILPLKFYEQEWARQMMEFFGGVEYAGLIHRGCAILTFYYFLSAILMSIDFLFVRRDYQANWLLRLFGPDSLMPNFRDIRDIKAMVLWFFFKGPKPTFERWTYWEKFDFLAVFWGMFAIGGSGLLLWFPELFGAFLPGWMFNVATIIHSDEALLATGFIFTVHFFNTHGRPEKFPMDFVIFNGQLSKEEFIEERGDQWKRYEDAGVTEDYHMEKVSGPLYDFVFKGIGFIALFTGLGLAILMLMAFISG